MYVCELSMCAICMCACELNKISPLAENASQLSSSTYTILPLADGSARRLLLIANPAAIESEGTQRVGTTGGIRVYLCCEC